MVNITKPTELRLEYEGIVKDFTGYHGDMKFYLDAYNNNVFYPDKPNAPKRKRVGVNFLQIFADKLWDYHSAFPKMSVPSSPDTRQTADLCEKVIGATHIHNDAELMWTDQTFDGAVLSCVITYLEYDFKENCVREFSVDPRRAVWKRANGMTQEITTFWFIEPMTKTAIKDQYGVEPEGDAMTMQDLAEYDVASTDGEDYYAVITRVDGKTMVKFAGNKLLMTPHNHMIGAFPVVITFPLKIRSYDKRGDFYLRRLLDLQAEFNDFWQQRAAIVRKLGNPTVWGRGIKQKQFQPVKDAMSLDGGFVGLSEQGELGLLTIPETKMIDNSLIDCFARMRDVAGFPTAAFGEIAGANTSGDALGMYFQPTTRMIEKMNNAYRSHWRKVNAIILTLYKNFLPMDQPKTLYGAVPGGKYVQGAEGMQYQMPSQETTFTGMMLGNNVHNVVTMNPVAPKDELKYKELLIAARQTGDMSRIRFYEEWGLESPEDELALLKEEQAEPLLNPEGTKMMMEGAADAMGVGSALQPTNPGV